MVALIMHAWHYMPTQRSVAENNMPRYTGVDNQTTDDRTLYNLENDMAGME